MRTLWAGYTPKGRLVCAWPLKRRVIALLEDEFGDWGGRTYWGSLKAEGFYVKKITIQEEPRP